VVIGAWTRVSTQLRVGFGGVVGLDYAGCRALLEVYGLWCPDIIRGLQVMERVLLEHSSSRQRSDHFQLAADERIEADG